jgi:hypothetical protein
VGTSVAHLQIQQMFDSPPKKTNVDQARAASSCLLHAGTCLKRASCTRRQGSLPGSLCRGLCIEVSRAKGQIVPGPQVCEQKCEQGSRLVPIATLLCRNLS